MLVVSISWLCPWMMANMSCLRQRKLKRSRKYQNRPVLTQVWRKLEIFACAKMCQRITREAFGVTCVTLFLKHVRVKFGWCPQHIQQEWRRWLLNLARSNAAAFMSLQQRNPRNSSCSGDAAGDKWAARCAESDGHNSRVIYERLGETENVTRWVRYWRYLNKIDLKCHPITGLLIGLSLFDSASMSVHAWLSHHGYVTLALSCLTLGSDWPTTLFTLQSLDMPSV